MYRSGYYRYAESGYLPITLLKEFVYCPRLAYLELFTGYSYVTDSMERGREVTVDYAMGAARGLRRPRVQQYVRSRSLRLYGVADLVGEVEGGLAVYEFKPLSQVSRRSLWGRHRHFLVQAVAYAMAAEETLRRPAAAVYIVGAGGAVMVRPTPSLREVVRGYSKRLHEMVERELEPEPVRTQKCGYCRMRRVCRP